MVKFGKKQQIGRVPFILAVLAVCLMIMMSFSVSSGFYSMFSSVDREYLSADDPVSAKKSLTNGVAKSIENKEYESLSGKRKKLCGSPEDCPAGEMAGRPGIFHRGQGGSILSAG